VPAGARRVTVLWKNSARHNALLLTEQCDNYCLMCSQPPEERDDSWLFDRARKVVSLLPASARSVSLTGGEPTLHADALIGLLEHCKQFAPELS
jgi:molybdenum cofactor biosynthesis enzyme MoaA